MKISLLQCYEVLWIHYIDKICTPSGVHGIINAKQRKCRVVLVFVETFFQKISFQSRNILNTFKLGMQIPIKIVCQQRKKNPITTYCLYHWKWRRLNLYHYFLASFRFSDIRVFFRKESTGPENFFESDFESIFQIANH